MEDLTLRMERANVSVGRLLAKRKEPEIFQYLDDEGRKELTKNIVEKYLEKKNLELQRERCADILGWYKALVDLGVELDVGAKNEMRSFLSHLIRQHLNIGENFSGRTTSKQSTVKWLNGIPR